MKFSQLTSSQEKQILELVAIVSLFGFLNRRNDFMGTVLEDGPAEFAKAHLSQSGWEIGKHS